MDMSLFENQNSFNAGVLDNSAMSSQTFQDLITKEVRKMMFTSPLESQPEVGTAVPRVSITSSSSSSCDGGKNDLIVPERSSSSSVASFRQRAPSVRKFSETKTPSGEDTCSEYGADSPNSCTSQTTVSPSKRPAASKESSQPSKRKRNGVEKLNKEERRRRNCAASARFRQKKKQEAAYLEEVAQQKTEETNQLKRTVKTLETEVAYLKQLLVLCTSNGGKIHGFDPDFASTASSPHSDLFSTVTQPF